MKDFILSDNKMTCGCCYHEKKVKESIRLLKEDFKGDWSPMLLDLVNKKIDYRAGVFQYA